MKELLLRGASTIGLDGPDWIVPALSSAAGLCASLLLHISISLTHSRGLTQGVRASDGMFTPYVRTICGLGFGFSLLALHTRRHITYGSLNHWRALSSHDIQVLHRRFIETWFDRNGKL